MGKGSSFIASRFVMGGGGTGTSFAWSRLYAKPDGDAPLLGVAERATDDLDEVRRQIDVVDRDLERLLRGGEELGERVGGPLGRLAAVDQRLDFDACHSALWAFFAAW